MTSCPAPGLDTFPINPHQRRYLAHVPVELMNHDPAKKMLHSLTRLPHAWFAPPVPPQSPRKAPRKCHSEHGASQRSDVGDPARRASAPARITKSDFADPSPTLSEVRGGPGWLLSSPRIYGSSRHQALSTGT